MRFTQIFNKALLSCSLAQAVAGPQSSNDTAASVFVSGNDDIAFALNVPNNSATDLYFSIMLPSQRAWGAIGLGSNQMAGALMLVIYAAKDGQNVTVSPRLASGHTEPVFTPDIQIQTLPGTGLFNGSSAYLFNGKCTNCRSWSSGGGKNKTIDLHYSYGTFTMDMVRATGPAGVPAISQDGKNPGRVGTEERLQVEGKTDRAGTAHAVIMVFVFVGLFPFGTLVLRLGNWVRWHAINQGFGGLLVIIGFGLGAHISKLYNRSKNFSSAHQVIGIFIFIFVLGQFALGFFHHRIYQKTQEPKKIGPVTMGSIHVWLGRLIILLGVINGFLGFNLAQSSYWNLVLGGLIIFVFPVIAVILVSKHFISKRWNSRDKNDPKHGTGFDLEPWRQTAETQQQASYQPNPNFSRPPQVSQPAGATGLSGVPQGATPGYQVHIGSGAAPLGPQQATREYV
ncbi:cellobiose dehydrogenase [Apiospora kogelbergensis]|uniref:Cellobiose dehydrogenase n=1 Tax=Apiospora kogelbergensis TaxID=1337665 RepID=A0AAW0QSE7_9PEZI